MQHMEPETCRQHRGRGTLGWKKLRSLKHAKPFFFFFASSLHSVTPSCCLLINFVLSLSSNTPCASQPSLRVFLYFFGFQNIHLEPCRSFLHLSCLSFNFPPHSHSYSVCECTRISIRPLETPVQFPGRL